MSGGSRAQGAARRWAESLAAWAIPDDILAAAPESPWGFPPELFSAAAAAALSDDVASPSRSRALEAIPPGGVVLDVGVGGGAAGLPLAPPASVLIGVDESEAMLDSFRSAARTGGVAHEVILGTWPEVAAEAPKADVVVCHHVAYNVADLAPFLLALDEHARRRVVLELTAAHPLIPLNPLWRALHGVERPEGPTAADALALATEAGLAARIERFERPSLWAGAGRPALVAFARRRLCVGPERDDEIAGLLDAAQWRASRPMATLWWDAGA
jgi:SAM-dependent methyltransferase